MSTLLQLIHTINTLQATVKNSVQALTEIVPRFFKKPYTWESNTQSPCMHCDKKQNSHITHEHVNQPQVPCSPKVPGTLKYLLQQPSN